ncbi:Ubiquitin-conjugating enzyme E2 [Spironucleus salmonicida]|uniref:Ubiquitin-conjugating enzyme E2 n=1 Tax=Spironucleus salmonicida TaxID=348837 RepID=V6LND8_9EUKA|nr:Ubiquitin-conjugating enzyme E2 [Spironucleus salmonicida]|eukprot:EST45231.1 Ubiquitin-conjugating enzyme E2 [Spironucleus salmonicida]
MISNTRRLQNELKLFRENPPIQCSGGPQDNNIFQWECQVVGSNTSAYSGKIFKIIFNFPQEYPFKQPICEFLTPIYHPNLSIGILEIEILDQWLPVYTVSKVLEFIRNLLQDPNIENYICNQEAASKYQEDIETFTQEVDKIE